MDGGERTEGSRPKDADRSVLIRWWQHSYREEPKVPGVERKGEPMKSWPHRRFEFIRIPLRVVGTSPPLRRVGRGYPGVTTANNEDRHCKDGAARWEDQVDRRNLLGETWFG